MPLAEFHRKDPLAANQPFKREPPLTLSYLPLTRLLGRPAAQQQLFTTTYEFANAARCLRRTFSHTAAAREKRSLFFVFSVLLAKFARYCKRRYVRCCCCCCKFWRKAERVARASFGKNQLKVAGFVVVSTFFFA